MIEYRGTREADGGALFVNFWDGAKKRAVSPRFDLRKHSPTGFECGYEGSGPAQLALAICCDHLRRNPELYDVKSDTDADRVALRVYQDFKRSVIATLPIAKSWTLADDAIATVLATLVPTAREEIAS